MKFDRPCETCGSNGHSTDAHEPMEKAYKNLQPALLEETPPDFVRIVSPEEVLQIVNGQVAVLRGWSLHGQTVLGIFIEETPGVFGQPREISEPPRPPIDSDVVHAE